MYVGIHYNATRTRAMYTFGIYLYVWSPSKWLIFRNWNILEQCDKIVRFFVYKVSQILNEILGNFKKFKGNFKAISNFQVSKPRIFHCSLIHPFFKNHNFSGFWKFSENPEGYLAAWGPGRAARQPV